MDAGWLGRKESNLRMPESKSGALPLGYAPFWAPARADARGARTIPTETRSGNRRSKPQAARRLLPAEAMAITAASQPESSSAW
jgi:hypothetical protein